MLQKNGRADKCTTVEACQWSRRGRVNVEMSRAKLKTSLSAGDGYFARARPRLVSRPEGQCLPLFSSNMHIESLMQYRAVAARVRRMDRCPGRSSESACPAHTVGGDPSRLTIQPARCTGSIQGAGTCWRGFRLSVKRRQSVASGQGSRTRSRRLKKSTLSATRSKYRICPKGTTGSVITRLQVDRVRAPHTQSLDGRCGLTRLYVKSHAVWWSATVGGKHQ